MTHSESGFDGINAVISELKHGVDALQTRIDALMADLQPVAVDHSSDDDGTEYTEWDEEGNVIARGWNAHPDRCAHCGAWGDDDHMKSCPEHITNILASRTVIETFVDEDEGTLQKTLSPLPQRVMQPVFDKLLSDGYVLGIGSRAVCRGCGHNAAMTLPYAKPGTGEGPFFEVCHSCWNVYETTLERVAAPKPFQDITPDPIAEALASRTVIRLSVYEADGLTWKRLSPLPISIMQPVIAKLIDQGYLPSHDGVHRCEGCGCPDCLNIIYDLPNGTDGPSFDICPRCWNVWEAVIELTEAGNVNEVVTPHSEELPTDDRIGPVPCDLQVKVTTPLPASSDTANGLYAV